MSFSGGTFNINTTGQPVVSGTTISASVFNALTADLATGLSTCMLKDGTQTITANIPMSSFKFTGLPLGSANGDSISRSQALTLYKSTSQSISNSTTIVDDTDLQFSIAANEIWVMEYTIDAGANLSTTGCQLQMTVPSGCTMSFKPSVQVDVISASGTYVRVTGTSGATLDFGTTNLPGASEGIFRILAYASNGSTAGSVKLRWAPSTNTGTALAFRAGSCMFARRMA